jgi:hypothetical protein
MFGFLMSKRPVRTAPRVRSFLRLEELGVRATPTDLLGEVTAPPPVPPPPLPGPVLAAPKIDTFTAAEIGHGWYTFSGHVTSANPAGLVITFNGVPCLVGRTTTVEADGTFSMTIQVATNGSDIGTISAQTSQNGMLSNLAMTYMSPTP